MAVLQVPVKAPDQGLPVKRINKLCMDWPAIFRNPLVMMIMPSRNKPSPPILSVNINLTVDAIKAVHGLLTP